MRESEDSKVEKLLKSASGSIADMQRIVVEHHISNHLGNECSTDPSTPEKKLGDELPHLLHIGGEVSKFEASPPAPTPTNYKEEQGLRHLAPTVPSDPYSEIVSSRGRGAKNHVSSSSDIHTGSEPNTKPQRVVNGGMSATVPANSTLAVEEVLPNLAEARKKLLLLKSRKRVRKKRST